MKRIVGKRGGLLLLVNMLLLLQLHGQQPAVSTLKEGIEALQAAEGVYFVYDASLNLEQPYRGRPLSGMAMKEALEQLFAHTSIAWEAKNGYILLFAARAKAKSYTVSGHISQRNGESLLHATVIDIASGRGTLSNAHGFFSLTLPEGGYKLRFSYVGCKEEVVALELTENRTVQIYLDDSPLLDEVVVLGNLNAPLYTTQTGKVTLTPSQLNKEFALFSSPDLVKTLQNLPGVAAGTEMISGLYVHGGDNDSNLFLLDGTPLYQINHLGGLFSAFNTDIVKSVDFYKSGFPARYGGRLSSVIDVRTKEGDMTAYHGSLSVGLLDGRVQLEGPLVKEKTSFNIALRRSWADLFTTAATAIYNGTQEETRLSMGYAFHDMNAKVTHRFSEKSKLYASFYSGKDGFETNTRQEFESYVPDTDKEHFRKRFNVEWGNLTTSLNWSYQLSPKLFSNVTTLYTRSQSSYSDLEDSRYSNEGVDVSVQHTAQQNVSTINDAGYRLAFDYRPNAKHYLRFGSNYLYHRFRPQSNSSLDFSGSEQIDTLRSDYSKTYGSNEFTFYAEDDMELFRKLKLNIGLHYTLFDIEGECYHSLEPRVAVSYSCQSQWTVKASYTQMSQFTHQLSNSYLNLPTDYWVPSTKQIRPKISRQIAAGLYGRLSPQLSLAVEGYYTTMNNLITCTGSSRLEPSAENWESLVKVGQGKAYGAELSLSYLTPNFSADAYYTLSWSKRKFTDIYPEWYADKFDNRHKLTLAGRYQFSKTIDVYAQWNYHSGDKMSMPSHCVNGPSIPGVDNPPALEWIYEEPNNVSLPAYHRLDVGANFRSRTKRGREQIWNVSIYNAYSRMNPLYGEVEQLPDGSFQGRAFGIFPIIPSCSYTIKF